MTSQQSTAETQPRVIRVFVSSTFRDMQAERDELVKFIFPQLRMLCEQRGVTWGEVDLRWGITDEQKSEGKVLPICLDEIQRCRPYFIGVLGERYGWVPHEISQDLIERETWLNKLAGRSVTELEILHGVLNNPKMAEHAFFYFRDPGYLNTLPPEQKSAFLESDIAEDIKKDGLVEAHHRTEQRTQKLADLKERIRNSGLPVHENYRNPKEFGQIVLQDLTGIIDSLYPEGSLSDPLDREGAEHEIFALSRAQVYIGRQTYFDQLDAHAQSDEQPLVVLGESGSGKSALLSNWAMHYRTRHQDDLVVMHFIGATPSSADWAAMLRRILAEFKRRFGIQEKIPDRPDAMRSAFADWLNIAATQGRVILVLDALNQLDDRDGAPDLVWLPPHIPENVRMLLSTLPGRPLDEVKKRSWPALTIEPLQYEERKQLIKEYLALSTKTLDPASTERIAEAAQCQSPLFLRVLLDELRLFGIHERLGQQIEHYLEAQTIPSLYQLILERCEQDYERERPGLVQDAMSRLWAARRGLSEGELLELLGTEGQPMPHAYLSPLHLALEQSFLSRSGLIGFIHNYLRQAVQNRYLPNLSMQESAHLRLADYFEAQPGASPRRLDELPWQVAQAKDWQRLNILLGDLEFFEVAWASNSYEVKTHWAQVEANSPYRLLDTYRQVIDHPDLHKDNVWQISSLLGDTGHLDEALALRTYLVKHYRQAGDKGNLQGSLMNQGVILGHHGDLDGAMELYKEAERISRRLGDKDGLRGSLTNQANIHHTRGNLDRALALHKQAERLCRELGEKDGLGLSLNNQATILTDRGELDGAMALFKETERLCREQEDKDGLQRTLGNQANILYHRGELDGAMALFKETERICRELGDKDGLSVSLGNQGNILHTRGDLDSAMALQKETEGICHELGDKDNLQSSLNRQALILYDRGDLDGAMALHKEVERLCRELGKKDGLGISLGNQALILSARGDLDGAMALHKQEERICLELGDKAGLARTLSNQGIIHSVRGDMDRALALHEQVERICLELGDKVLLQTSLANQANIYYHRGDLERSMVLHKEEERICRELGYKDGLQYSLGNQAVILEHRGDLDGAMALQKEKENICRELRDKAGLKDSLANQGIILYHRGDLDGAMALYLEQERICRELGDKKGLGLSYGNQALILRDRHDLDGAMALHKQEERLYRELGDKAGLGLSYGNQANILSDRGDGNGAMALHKKEERLYRELGDKDGLQLSLGNQALSLKVRGDLDGAMALQKEQEALCREMGNMMGLAISLKNKAIILGKMGKKGEARRMAEESLKLAQEHGYRLLAEQIKSIRDRW